MKIGNRLQSRKLWMTLFAVLLPVLNRKLNLGLDATSVIAIEGAISAYLLGQSYVDATNGKK